MYTILSLWQSCTYYCVCVWQSVIFGWVITRKSVILLEPCKRCHQHQHDDKVILFNHLGCENKEHKTITFLKAYMFFKSITKQIWGEKKMETKEICSYNKGLAKRIL